MHAGARKKGFHKAIGKLDFRVGEYFRAPSATTPTSEFTIAPVINWYGPYSSRAEAAAACTKFGIVDGFYAVKGRSVPLRLLCRRYIGLSNNLRSRLSNKHHKLDKVGRPGIEIWIGQFTQPTLEIAEGSTHALDLSRTEWALIQALRPNFNEALTDQPPKQRMIIRNHHYDPSGALVTGGTPWLPHIIDYPYDSSVEFGRVPFNLYWLDEHGRIIRKRKVRPKRSVADLMLTGPYSTIRRPQPVIDSLSYFLIGALIVGFGYENNRPATATPVLAEVSTLEKQIDDLIKEKDDLEQKNEELEREAERRQKIKIDPVSTKDAQDTDRELESARQKGNRSLDAPPCWKRNDTQPDYLFDVKMTVEGLTISRAFGQNRIEDYEKLPVAGLQLNVPLDAKAFTSAVRPIFHHSVKENCRHFVRLHEGRYDDLRLYKGQRAAVESNFYIFLRPSMIATED